MLKDNKTKKQKLGVYATFYNGPLGKFFKIIPHWDHKHQNTHNLQGQLAFAKLEKFKKEHGVGVSIHYDQHMALLKLASTGTQYMHRQVLLLDTLTGTIEENKAKRDEITQSFKKLYEDLGYKSLGKKQTRLGLGLAA